MNDMTSSSQMKTPFFKSENSILREFSFLKSFQVFLNNTDQPPMLQNFVAFVLVFFKLS